MRFFKFSFLNVFWWLIFLVAVVFIYKYLNPPPPQLTTATVERGNVTELVSVSGFVEAKQIANLAFPSSGVVTDVFVEEGSLVEVGEVLATLANTKLVAERNEAVAALASARAAYNETAAGPRTETIAVANTSVKNAEAQLKQVIAEENRKVNNARIALLSTGLNAATTDPNENSTAPIVSGNYTCDKEGIYNIQIYRSNSTSGYSYNYTGLESGTTLVSTDQPAAIGECGLYLQFTADDRYDNSTWEITIPNTRSVSYTSLNNAFTLVTTQAKNAIAAAENSLTLAQKQSGLSTAGARPEAVTQASAAIAQAQARVAAVDAKMADLSVVAPFTGIITDVSIIKGETSPVTPVITILADNTFTLKARIPEIDITKIELDQDVKAIFDAKSDETLNGKIVYIAPVATLIDGVAYFETIIKLEQNPNWLRSGLNADVDIITKTSQNVLRLPKRFVVKSEDGASSVLLQKNNNTATTSVEVVFTGNDGYLEVTGLNEGDVVIAP